MGLIMTDQSQYADKIKEYEKLLAQDHKSLVFVPLTSFFLKTGQLDDALEVALKGTWELPDYAPGFVAVGHVYSQRKVPHKAIAAFQKALEIDPSSLDAYKGLARFYREQGNNDAASNLLTNAIFLFPDEPSLKKMLESLVPVESAPTPEPTAPTPVQEENGMKPITTATIADIYIEQGLYDKALEIYRDLYTETQNPIVAQKIAEIEMLAQEGKTQPSTDVAPMAVPASVAERNPATVITTEAGSRSGGSVLDTLNSMLTSIQARRNRV